MMRVSLSFGRFALVDDEDFGRVMRGLKWYAQWDPKMGAYYALRHTYVEGVRKSIRMHRFIMGLESGDTRHVDHADHDTLNNQKHNLRVVSASGNFHNRRKITAIDTSSPYKGVDWNKRQGKWRARIRVPNLEGGRGKSKFLGYFTDVTIAAQAYDRAAKDLFGDQALLNFPE